MILTKMIKSTQLSCDVILKITLDGKKCIFLPAKLVRSCHVMEKNQCLVSVVGITPFMGPKMRSLAPLEIYHFIFTHVTYCLSYIFPY